ncbi:glycosyltransferase family 4 protein [Anabaena cylindrica FACHB-243]|uniref:Glycosyl transferase group 1 n=1 Tax=Anabaena cylindrica (strain ATCC 27899 / PCC 7122) TaxID=272123 RepID=K9ZFR3_ANACC|nr:MULTISPECIES: glycosyltransferase family 4 protein [Anabaena]AFZ58063.1 glycosyl transferase group 1 [Anabaena cylindrica PCC 7122]MBD2419162.1 glycosyltransferase family 4 protein [Anabaena cylindrica FACHB-243]MBY5284017.1 glycosyltransferase family 4 protein [Anabaena sp. CCAP 1446/1C]MBY5306846.1 glycosyltransferase family 4 protein [Anabaena sp. CCAP 1446/1C]MCM2409634.1 glycosyltransferase family 4 protein [Anabaena sp. CCAP 1446/1C]
MRIIHILNHIQEIGNGIVNVAVDLACLQAKHGNEVAIISGGGEYEKLLHRFGVRHYQIDQNRQPVNIIKAAVAYRAIVQEFKPDIVHAHMMTGLVLAHFLKFKNKYALVSTVHNEFQRASLLMGLAERVIAVSNSVQISMVQRGVPENKLRVVRNGTLGSPRTRQISDYQPLNLQHPAIATVAGMYKRKGITELIAAFEQIAQDFPTAHLYLVGNGPDREIFETQAQATSVSSRIHFEGFQSEPQGYLLSCDIFVLASHRDPCPLVLSEAREAGVAIIATEVDGIPEALDHGQAGVLVPAKNSQALAEALVKLLSNPDILQDWKHRSQENLESLSIARVNQETLAVYRELV